LAVFLLVIADGAGDGRHLCRNRAGSAWPGWRRHCRD
jgi:hypothetical protein